MAAGTPNAQWLRQGARNFDPFGEGGGCLDPVRAAKGCRGRLSCILNMLRTTFWLLPLTSMIINAALAIGLVAASTAIDQDEFADLALEMCGACAFIFTGSASDAKTLLVMISGAAISIATLTFSLTVLAIQLAAVNYSPRLLDEFLKDPVAKRSFAVMLGAFVFCYFTLLNTYEESALSPAFVPYLAVNFSIVHLWAVTIMFLMFIEHFVNSLRLERMMAKATRSASDAANRLRVLDDTEERAPLPEVPAGAQRALADSSGYVSAWTMGRVETKAKELDVVVRYACCSGEFVTEGTLLGWVWPSDGDNRALARRVREQCADEMEMIRAQQRKKRGNDKVNSDGAEAMRSRKQRRNEGKEKTERKSLTEDKTQGSSSSSSGNVNSKNTSKRNSSERDGEEDAQRDAEGDDDDGGASDATDIDDMDAVRLVLWRLVNQGVTLTVTRGREQDVSLGIQQLSDIAVRALSPGVNDPHSAIQAMDSLSVIFARLTVSEFTRSLARDEDDNIRVVAPVRGFPYMLGLGMDGIRAYGAGDASVVRRALYFLGDVGSIAARVRRPRRVEAVRDQLERWRSAAELKLGSVEMASVHKLFQHAQHSIGTAESLEVPDDEDSEHHDEAELEGRPDQEQEEANREDGEETEDSGGAPAVPVTDTSVMGVLRNAVNDMV